MHKSSSEWRNTFVFIYQQIMEAVECIANGDKDAIGNIRSAADEIIFNCEDIVEDIQYLEDTLYSLKAAVENAFDADVILEPPDEDFDTSPDDKISAEDIDDLFNDL